MTRELLERPTEALSKQLTDVQLEEIINKQLSDAIESKMKSGELTFSSSESSVASNPSTLDISRFGSLGLQDPDDLRQFLLTEAGKTVIHEIADEVNLEQAREEELQFEIQQQILEEQRIKALLFHWFLDEEEESKKAQEELIAEQQEKVLNQNENHTPQSAPPPQKDTNGIVKAYSDSIDKCSKDHRALGERIDKLEKERALLGKKYDSYEQSFKDFDDEAHEFEAGTKNIDAEIEQLKKEADKIADKMSTTSDEKDMHQLVNKLNTIGFKIANLENIRSVKNGEKRFADADGKFKDENGKPITFKNAAFVLSHDQKIEKDKFGHHYLLEKDQSLTKMTDAEKVTANENYTHAKKDLQLVKHLVQDVKKEELHSNATQLAKHKAEHTMLQNHINLMHQARANAKMGLKQSPHLTIPQSSMTPEKAFSSISTSGLSKPSTSPPRPSAQEVLGNFVKNSPQPMTWGVLFKFVNEIPNPKARNETNKFLVDRFEKDQDENPDQPKQKESLAVILKHPEKFKRWLTSTLSAAPVPDATMQDLLKNMATKSQDPYNPEVTSEKSPLELQQEQQQPTSTMK